MRQLRDWIATHGGHSDKYDHLNKRQKEDIDSGIDITTQSYIHDENVYQRKKYQEKLETERKYLDAATQELNIDATNADLPYLYWKDQRLVIVLRISRLYPKTTIHRMGKTLMWLNNAFKLDHSDDVSKQMMDKVVSYNEATMMHITDKKARNKMKPKTLIIQLQLTRDDKASLLLQRLQQTVNTYNAIESTSQPHGVKAEAGHNSYMCLQDRNHAHRITYVLHGVPLVADDKCTDKYLNMVQYSLRSQICAPFPGTIERMAYADGKPQTRLLIEILGEKSWTLNTWQRHYQVQMDERLQRFMYINPNLSYLLTAKQNEIDVDATHDKEHQRHVELQWKRYIMGQQRPSNAYFLLTRSERRYAYYESFINRKQKTAPDPKQTSNAMSHVNEQMEIETTNEILADETLDALTIKTQIKSSNIESHTLYKLVRTQQPDSGGNTFTLIGDSRLTWQPNTILEYAKNEAEESYLYITASLMFKKAIFVQYESSIAVINLMDEQGNTITNLQFAPITMVAPNDKETNEFLINAGRETVQRFIMLYIKDEETFATSPLMNLPTKPTPTNGQIRVSMLTGRLGTDKERLNKLLNLS